MSRILVLFSVILSLFRISPARAQDANADRLTRAVKFWQAGNALAAYQSLDSISAQPFNSSNAIYKIRASIWTATYLQEQHKVRTAQPFLDSAATWAKLSGIPDEMKRAYEANAKYFQSTGNVRAAQAWQQQLNNLSDSLETARRQAQMDSLHVALALTQKEAHDSIALAKAETATTKEALSSSRIIAWMLGILSCILFAIVIVMANKKRARPPHTSPVAKNSVTIEPLPVKVGTAIPTIAAPPEKTKDVYKDHHSLTARISAVELVLIQADTLGWKMNGDGKATHKILQRYVDDFNSLTKAIDDAIAANKASEIISSLELLRPYLEAFGMNGTTKMVDEIKLEGANVKVNKMLSRVFQIRNHARRALDEAKAILEKVSL